MRGRRHPILLLLGLAAGVVSLTAGIGSAGYPEDFAGEPKEVINEDIVAIAEVNGITVSEAIRAESVIAQAEVLQAKLRAGHAEAFGGLFFDYAPRPVITVNWNYEAAGDPPGWLSEASTVKVNNVDFSEADLVNTQAAFNGVADAHGVKADTWTDVRNGTVQVEILKEDRSSLRRLMDSDLERISIRETDSLTVGQATVYAGMSGTRCTSGFTVRHAAHGLRATTAGHCSNVQSFGDINVPSTLTGEWEGGSRDFQHHRLAAGHTAAPRIHFGPSPSRPVTRVATRDNTVLGITVCKYGETTKYTCGKVASTTFKPDHIPSASSVYVRVNRIGSGDISRGGDSGAPWFSGQTAYGWHSGGVKSGSFAVYMSASYLPPGWTVALA